VNENARGVALMMAAMFGFVVNDTIIKLVGQTMPLGQLLFVRGIFASLMIGVLVRAFHQPFVIPRTAWRWMSMRLAGELITTFGFLTALMNMPLANATAILQFTPIMITFVAIVVFSERVGWRRWSAILAGFVGVMIVIRPGLEGFNLYSLLAFSAVIGSTLRDMATRKLPHHVHNLTITSYTSLLIMVSGFMLMTFGETPVDIDAASLVALASSAVFVLIGYFCITAAMRQGELSIVTPFRYSIFPFAIILGLVVFSDWPDAATLIGGSIIVASGIVTIVRGLRDTKIGPG
jgi:S-adenosylmethionine uptake transporter